ncbi:voltage-gated potassium channel [Cadophora sp. DSE1049]|nr:voltage-gated potassium channel [Cadophora sp. DSE1049]
MNDPGLDEPISNDAKDVENQRSDDKDDKNEEEQEFLAPSRWWLASTAFPLIAGTFGPMASAFSICALLIAFYYAIFSAGLYFLVASLMLITVWGASKGHYDKEFQLTMSQRTLMLQTISFLVYLLCGATVFAHIEGWNFLDAVYWADFTLLTVGIGDFSPSTHTGRGLLFPFAIGGIIILGLVIGSIRSLVLERGKVKMGARMVEKERRRLIAKLEKKDKAAVLQPISSDQNSQNNHQSTNTNTNGNSISTSNPQTLSRISTKTLTSKPNFQTECQRREREFTLMRRIQERAHKRRLWTSLTISATVWLALWFAGAAIFHASESRPQSWTYFASLYFSYTSLLTIGYGDIYPVSNAGKAFFVFWSLLAVPSLTILISNMGDTIVKGIRDLTLWVGNFTVLPGEKGVLVTVKEGVGKVTGGRVGGVEEMPPGLLGESERRDGDVASIKSKKNDTNSTNPKPRGARKAGGKRTNSIPKSKNAYHVILVREMSKVMSHLNSSPPKEYSFEEWAWYLKLIGEDESSEETHRRPLRRPEADSEGLGVVGEEREELQGRLEWSWMGNRSPLMGGKEEAEWVLERLMRRLEGELEELRREEAEGRGVGLTREEGGGEWSDSPS